MDGTSDTVRDYLKKPYARILTPDEEYGGYTAEILEFPGCVTEGDTADEALENLEAAAEGWIEAALGANQRIPEPSDSQGYGGRVALRLPRSLHRRAVQMAEREGTSLNQFLVFAVAEKVGAGNLYEHMTQALERRWQQMTANTVIGVAGVIDMSNIYNAPLLTKSLLEDIARIRRLPGKASTADRSDLQINLVQQTQELTEAHG